MAKRRKSRRKSKVDIGPVIVTILIIAVAVGVFFAFGPQQAFLTFNTQSVTSNTILLEETDDGYYFQSTWSGYTDDTACSQQNPIRVNQDIQFAGVGNLGYDLNDASNPVSYYMSGRKTTDVKFSGLSATQNLCSGVDSKSLAILTEGTFAECEGGHIGDWGDDVICRVSAEITAVEAEGNVAWRGLSSMIVTWFSPKEGVQCAQRNGISYNCDEGFECNNNQCEEIPTSDDDEEEEESSDDGSGEDESAGGEDDESGGEDDSGDDGSGGDSGNGGGGSDDDDDSSDQSFGTSIRENRGKALVGYGVVGIVALLLIMIMFSVFRKGKRKRRRR